MDPDTHILEELKRVDTKAGSLFSALVSLIAVTVAIIGLGHVPQVARILIAASQIVFVLAIYPVLLAIAPRMLGRRQNGPSFGLTAWSRGDVDDEAHRRLMLARRAVSGYRHVSVAVLVMGVGLALLVAAGVATVVALSDEYLILMFGGRTCGFGRCCVLARRPSCIVSPCVT